MAIRCNSCGKEIEGQALTTFCSHCYCLECANDICQGDNSCRICGSQLNGSNVSVEAAGDSESVLQSLRGSSPEEIIMVVSEALVFNETQRHLANKFQAKSHKGKCKQVVDSSKAKMAEMHKAYKNLVQKAKSIVQDKAEKQAMVEELRKKAQESSRICRKLQEQLKAQQTKASVLHQQLGLEHGLSPMQSGAGSGRLPAMQSSRHQSHALVPYGTNQSHGHIPHSICPPHQQLLQQHAHNTGAVAMKNSPARHGLAMSMQHSHRSSSARPASPTLGAHTPSDCNGTSLSGRSGSGVSALLQGAGLGNRDTSIGRRQAAPIGSDPMNARRRSSVPSPRASCGSLSDLIKSRKR